MTTKPGDLVKRVCSIASRMPELRIPPGFIASCQPVRGGWFDEAEIVARYVRVCEAEGAGAVRIESLRDLEATRRVTDLPIIGLVKRSVPGSEVFITPSVGDVANVIAAGADVVAFDATLRPRPESWLDLLEATREAGRESMADIATFEEGIAAWNAGCTYVGTTLSGYVEGTPRLDGPDLDLVERLATAGVRTIAEGRFATPAQAKQAMHLGAFGVTIGTAISRPELLARGFARALE